MTTPAIIQDMFPQSRTAEDAFIRNGMSPIELQRLGDLIIQEKPNRVLEVGWRTALVRS